MKNNKFTAIGLALSGALSFSMPAQAETPFSSCPTQAFLVQNPSGEPVAYGMNIDLGSYSVLDSSLGTDKINGVGFSQQDDFIYGWDYGAKTLTKIDSTFTKYALSVSMPSNVPSSIYVGDVAVNEYAWYGYRPGSGLYRIDLDTLDMTLVANSAQFGSPAIFDIAFHPDNGYAYSVDSNGYLHRIDVNEGTSTRLNQLLDKSVLGFKLTFGAIYFDVDGNLYLSNNSNGYVYKVNIDGNSSTAAFYSYGPSSNSNDGARCALAPVEPSENTDFGDAPDSYQTKYASSGARHGITSLMLGSTVDGETEAYEYPLSDDASDGSDDDDGISFPTQLETGGLNLVIATVSGTSSGSILNAWIDWDQNGQFDDDEQVLTDQAVSDGSNTLYIDVPAWASSGDTWARFRLSNTSGIGPFGGVAQGEVEDYQVEVTEVGVTTEYYPSASSYTSFAYEDQYPISGDYDLNDVLMNVKYTEYIQNDQVIRAKIEGKIAALGGDYHSGFAIHLPNIPVSDIREESVELSINGQAVTGEILESGTTDAVFIIHQDLWQLVTAGEAEQCTYFRTQEGCGTTYRPVWTLQFKFQNPVDTSSMPDLPYDPFIFASPGYYYGDIGYQLTGGYPGRGLEIHLKNQAPTDKFDTRYRNLGIDSGNGSNTHFQTSNGLPWAIEIPTDWQHPKEAISILDTYAKFADFSQDSSGNTEPNWYTDANSNNAYSD